MAFIARALFGSHQEELTNAELVQKLCERISHARLLQDKLDAMANLKITAKNLKEDVGNLALPLICTLLLDNGQQRDIIFEALEILRILITVDSTENSSLHPQQISYDSILSFTVSLTQKEIVQRVIDLLHVGEYKLRLNAILLLSTIMSNCPKPTSLLLASDPVSISVLLDLISDIHEAIRNETILLLTMLARNSRTARHVIAFESGFEKLLLIVDKEGGIQSGIIVSDCLNLLFTLLNDDRKNQELFFQNRSLNAVSMLFSQLNLQSLSTISEMSLNNVLILLKILNCMTIESLFSNANREESFLKSGLLAHLCSLAINEDTPITVKLESYSSLAILINNSQVIQRYLFSSKSDCIQSRSFYHCSIIYMISLNQLSIVKFAILCCLCQANSRNYDIYNELCADNNQIRLLLHDSLFNGQPDVTTFCILLLFCSFIDSWRFDKQTRSSKEATRLVLFNVYTLDSFISLHQKIKSSSLASIGLATLLIHWLTADVEAIDIFLQNGTIAIELAMSFIEDDIFEVDDYSITDKANEDINLSESQQRNVYKSLSALIVGICVIKSNTESKIHSVVKHQIGVSRLIESIQMLSKHSIFKICNTSKPSFSVISGFEDKHLILDSTFRLYQSIQASVIRQICSVFNVDSIAWLYDNSFEIELPVKQLLEECTQCDQVDVTSKNYITTLTEEITQWRSFYQQYLKQQEEMINRYNTVYNENQGHIQSLVQKDLMIQNMNRQLNERECLSNISRSNIPIPNEFYTPTTEISRNHESVP